MFSNFAETTNIRLERRSIRKGSSHRPAACRPGPGGEKDPETGGTLDSGAARQGDEGEGRRHGGHRGHQPGRLGERQAASRGGHPGERHRPRRPRRLSPHRRCRGDPAAWRARRSASLPSASRTSAGWPPFSDRLDGLLAEELNQQGKPIFEVHTWEKLSPFFNIARMIDVMTLFIKLMLIAIVLISIMNVMIMAVYERIREIGTMAAIGTLPGKILSLFMIEGFCLGVGGRGGRQHRRGSLIIWILNLSQIHLRLRPAAGAHPPGRRSTRRNWSSSRSSSSSSRCSPACSRPSRRRGWSRSRRSGIRIGENQMR